MSKKRAVKAEDMAALFDVEPGDNVAEPPKTPDEPRQSFEDRTTTMKAIIKKEEPPNPPPIVDQPAVEPQLAEKPVDSAQGFQEDCQSIQEEIKRRDAQPPPQPTTEERNAQVSKNFDDVLAEVTDDSPQQPVEAPPEKAPPEPEKPIEKAEVQSAETPEEPQEAPEPPKETKPKVKKKTKKEASAESAENRGPLPADNPLGLTDEELAIYNQMPTKYPGVFDLCDGTWEFRNFYTYKFRAVRNVLVHYPMLKLPEIDEEIQSINVHHYVGENAVNPDILMRKMDAVLQQKARLSDILLRATMQISMWKSSLKLMTGKLLRDHPARGADKKDGLVTDHLSDITIYVAALEGTLAGGRRVHDMLDKCYEGLSRQLSCINTHEPTGFRGPAVAPVAASMANSHIMSIEPPVETGRSDVNAAHRSAPETSPQQETSVAVESAENNDDSLTNF